MVTAGASVDVEVVAVADVDDAVLLLTIAGAAKMLVIARIRTCKITLSCPFFLNS